MVNKLETRLLALEGATTAEAPVALILLQCAGRDPDSITGIAWMDKPRQPGERLTDYVRRIEEWLRATRPAALPALGIAEYATDAEGE